jgi:UDP-N-acetylglucosamine--N-acetylmuramyl-(pentapeptide) pyrophosphoryl-undecaprenol N-acetylglucosamine transferase
VVLLEQNVIPGRATRYLCRFAETVCLSFGETAKHLPGRAHTRLTGNPVRAAIAQLASGSHRSEADERTLLVLGGSQGARAVNDLVLAFAVRGGPALCGWRIVHQTGKEGEAIARETYAKHGIQATVAPFFESPETLYQAADLAVARAGGTTLAELACAGVPAIFIPYPHATANHQWHNASVFRDNEAAILCEESHDSPQSHERFCAALTSLLTDEVKRKAMSRAMTRLAHPDAAEQVADVILGLTLPGDSSST